MTERYTQINPERYRVDEYGAIVLNEQMESGTHERSNVSLSYLRRLGATTVILASAYGLVSGGNWLSSHRPIENIITNPDIAVGDIVDKVQGAYDFVHNAIEAGQIKKALTGDK